MSRSAFTGNTNYAHQSFDDIIHDLKEIIGLIKLTIKTLDENINELDKSNYWVSVDPNFLIIVFRAQKFFKTCIDELDDITKELQLEVKKHHIRRIYSLYRASEELDDNLFHFWKEDYQSKKDYGNCNFIKVERLYSECYQAILDVKDLSNMCPRLEDFLGKTKGKKESILEVKPEYRGIKLNLNELFRRIFKRK